MSFGAEFLVLCLAGVVSGGAAPVGSELCRSDCAFVETYGAPVRVQTGADEKASRTAAQKKIDSQLLYALKQKRGETKGVPTARIELDLDEKGRVLVDIAANVTTELKAQIQKLGGAVISDDARYRTIRARLTIEKLELLAKRNDVRFIAPAAQAMNNSVRPSSR
jgi:hypothetical protein